MPAGLDGKRILNELQKFEQIEGGPAVRVTAPIGIKVTSKDGETLTTAELKNDSILETLSLILHELKKTNYYLQYITDERIKEDDIECQ